VAEHSDDTGARAARKRRASADPTTAEYARQQGGSSLDDDVHPEIVRHDSSDATGTRASRPCGCAPGTCARAGAGVPPSEEPRLTALGRGRTEAGREATRSAVATRARAKRTAATSPESAPFSKTTWGGDDGSAPLLSTGEMARLAGSTLRTVRFYEEAGLLRPTRTEGGHRLFAVGELDKLRLASDLREAGLSIGEIRGLFELKRRSCTPDAASAELVETLGLRIAELQEKIALLRRLREELAATVAVVHECRHCEDPARFPDACGRCEVLDRPDLPRAVKLLWRQ
jgi:DNA-binding transcriptional MerR regulator